MGNPAIADSLKPGRLTMAELIEIAGEIVAAYVRYNSLSRAQLTELIGSVRVALVELAAGPKVVVPPRPVPAVEIGKSVTRDYLICLEDGKKLKLLRPYLKRKFGLTSEQYRAKWGLPNDYPMAAPGYIAQRARIAKELGLGTPQVRRRFTR